MSAERTAKKMRFGSDTIVTITVGSGESSQSFAVHETKLSTRSPFFKAALDKNWKEGQTRSIKLPDDKVGVFAHYLDFIYDGELDLPKQTSSETSEATEDAINARHMLLAHMYVFGEKVQDDAFCDKTMSAIVSMGKESPNWATRPCMQVIFEGTPSTSPVRRYYIEFYAKSAQASWTFEHTIKDIPELAAEVLREMCRLRETKDNDNFYANSGRWYKQSQKTEELGG